MPRPHPPEFRQRAVELARLGDKPVAEIAVDLGISDSCLQSPNGEGCPPVLRHLSVAADANHSPVSLGR